MNPILPDLETTFARLRQLPGVTKIVAGSISTAPHQHRSGDVKWVKSEKKIGLVELRGFSSRGMQNIHLYAKDVESLQKALKDVPKVIKKTETATVIPPESNIERKSREQPIYPAVATPMRQAAAVKDNGMVGRLVTVTPDIAINWLERNTRNRPLRDSDVKRYANDMKAGRWLPGGVVIKFDKNGTIVNGQHTLWGVVESGCNIEAYVLTGLDPDVVMVEDDHARRRLTDVVRITHPGSKLGNLHTAVGTMLRFSMAWHRGESGHHSNITRQQEMSFLDEYAECIDFAVRAFTTRGNKRGVGVSAVLTPVARAWHTEDRDKLLRFANVLTTGMVEDPARENVAILLRNALLNTPSMGSMLAKQDIYRKTERALRAYLNSERVQLLRPVMDEQFLLPGERKRARSS